MAKSMTSMKNNLIISTAGTGSRLHQISNKLNKALLPYRNRPIICHTIDQIPLDFKVGVLVGYRSEQVKDFLNLAYPERTISYIQVDDWTSEKSGTGYSLMCAEQFVNDSFWYFPCDGVYKNLDFLTKKYEEDVFVVSKVNPSQAYQYLTFSLSNGRIIDKFFKSAKPHGDFAFTGAMKIKDKSRFFASLEKTKSNEFVAVIEKDSLTHVTTNWADMGNLEAYLANLSESGQFDFSKKGEFTFQLDKKIIKWWDNPNIANFKLKKPEIKPEVFPKRVQAINQFLMYEKAIGYPYYEKVNSENFKFLLAWLQKNVWTLDDSDITKELRNFYEEKTTSRINALGKKRLQDNYNPKVINGIRVGTWEKYFEEINWNHLATKQQSSFIHGDLQFDNIIYNEVQKKFTLIDWRHEFSQLLIKGDIYYDFAKMLGGIHVNYQEIKKHNFDIQNSNKVVRLKIPTANESGKLITILESCAVDMGLDIEKIRTLVPIIFWNMASLHKEPFANICWCLGLMHFEMLK